MVRTTARLPKELTDWLATRAKANHRSANAEMIAVLSAQKARDEGVGLSGTPERDPTQVSTVFIAQDFASIEQRTAKMFSNDTSDPYSPEEK